MTQHILSDRVTVARINDAVQRVDITAIITAWNATLKRLADRG